MLSYSLSYKQQLQGEVDSLQMNTLKEWCPVLGHKAALDKKNQRLHIDASLTGKKIQIIIPAGPETGAYLGYAWVFDVVRQVRDLSALAGASVIIAIEGSKPLIKHDFTAQLYFAPGQQEPIIIKMPLLTAVIHANAAKTAAEKVTGRKPRIDLRHQSFAPQLNLYLGESDMGAKEIQKTAQKIAGSFALYFAPDSDPDVLVADSRKTLPENKTDNTSFLPEYPVPAASYKFWQRKDQPVNINTKQALNKYPSSKYNYLNSGLEYKPFR